MSLILYSIVTISILHALIPSHWLPLIAIAKKENWKSRETLTVAFYMALAHVLSTTIIGILLGYFSVKISEEYKQVFEITAPILLVLLGIYFIYRHYKHHHFHIDQQLQKEAFSKSKIIFSLMVVMFLSPCLEVEGVFLMAGKYGFSNVLLVALIYGSLSIVGIVLWVYIALHGLKNKNWHTLEHNAGLITGTVLILCGIFTYIYH